MVEITATKTVSVKAKTLKLHLKVCDNFTADLIDQDGETIFSQDDGYVPGFMPGDHYGDYVILDIDIDDGKITNWKKLSADDIEKWMQP
jgi:hypothetical protein